MSEFTALPIPNVPIGDQASAVRSAINVYSKLETYSQAEVDSFFFNRAPDADVTAYIAAIETALGTTIEAALPLAVNPKHKIYNFVTAEKSAARWALHKRIYLPIWGQADANAICLRSLTTGTFVGGVTPGAGFVQGDGTSGYFNVGASPSSLSLTGGSIHLAALRSVTGAAFEHFIGSREATASVLSSDNAQLFFAQGGPTGSYSLPKANQIGIIVSDTKSGTINVRRRVTSGASSVGTGAITTGALPTVNYFCMARNSFGTPDQFSTARYGAFSIGASLGDTTAIDAFTLNLKTLWETCTGLTLP